MSRTTARETAYLMLFSNQFNKNGFSNDELMDILDGKPINEEEIEYVKNTVNGVISHKDELIAVINKNIENYAFERIFSADLCAIMLATYELMFCKETPSKVVINEAINLVKKYSSDKSFSFVNSVLSKIFKDISNE